MQLANKLGFIKVAEQLDPEDGLEAVYVLEGETLQAALTLQAPTVKLIKLPSDADDTNQSA